MIDRSDAAGLISPSEIVNLVARIFPEQVHFPFGCVFCHRRECTDFFVPVFYLRFIHNPIGQRKENETSNTAQENTPEKHQVRQNVAFLFEVEHSVVWCTSRKEKVIQVS